MLIMHALILDLVDSDFHHLFRARKKVGWFDVDKQGGG